MNPQLQIQKLQQKIANYKAKFPKRTPLQTQTLNHLWLELIFWQLIQKKEITLPTYLPKIEQTWIHLKQIKAKTNHWPRKKLKTFLKKQPKPYQDWLILIIEQETNPEYLKFGKWLRKSTH